MMWMGQSLLHPTIPLMPTKVRKGERITKEVCDWWHWKLNEKITPEQEALLGRLNSGQYPTIQELSDDKGTKKLEVQKERHQRKPCRPLKRGLVTPPFPMMPMQMYGKSLKQARLFMTATRNWMQQYRQKCFGSGYSLPSRLAFDGIVVSGTILSQKKLVLLTWQSKIYFDGKVSTTNLVE